MNTISDLKTTRLKRDARPWLAINDSLLKSIYYYRRTALYTFLGVLALGLIAALLIPPRYRSEARLLALTSDSYDVQGNASGSPRSEPFKPDDVLNLEMQLLSSHDLHRAAVSALPGAPTDPLALERAREKFTDALSVTRVSGANVIELGFVNRDPALARQALQALIKAYYNSRAQTLTSGRTAMFEQQRDAAARDMVQANDALHAFQAAHGVADIDAQIAGAVTVDTALRQQRSETNADLSGAAGSLGSVRHSAQGLPSTIEMYRDDSEAARTIAEMQGQLVQLEAKRTDLAGRYMAGSPLIVQVDQQIAGLRTAIAAQRNDFSAARRIGRNGVYDAAQEQEVQSSATRAGLVAKRAQLGTEIDASGARLLSLNAIAGKIAELKQTRDAAQDRYRQLSSQVVEARTRDAEVMNGSTNVRIIQNPDFPARRTNSIPLLLIGAIVAGIVIAVAALFYRVTMRKVILDASEATVSANAPVIADLRHPGAGEVEDAMGLRNRLASLAHPADGAGRIVALLATQAEDHDWPLPDFLRRFEGDAGGGLAVVHFDPFADGSQQGGISGLTGSLPEASSFQVGIATWAADERAALLTSLRRDYRWIVLLVPPIADRGGAAPGDLVLEQAIASADGVLLVVHVERTLQSAAHKVASLSARLGRPLAGLIVTGQRIVWPRFLTER